MTITINMIKARQAELAAMIAEFEAQATTTLITFPEVEIELQAGEHYAGIVLSKDGEASYHLILLPGEAEGVTLEGAKGWAAEVGSELPTRREQSLLFANLKDQFQPAWYWSCEVDASDSDFAWNQSFSSGDQLSNHKTTEFRARVVRRSII